MEEEPLCSEREREALQHIRLIGDDVGEFECHPSSLESPSSDTNTRRNNSKIQNYFTRDQTRISSQSHQFRSWAGKQKQNESDRNHRAKKRMVIAPVIASVNDV